MAKPSYLCKYMERGRNMSWRSICDYCNCKRMAYVKTRQAHNLINAKFVLNIIKMIWKYSVTPSLGYRLLTHWVVRYFLCQLSILMGYELISQNLSIRFGLLGGLNRGVNIYIYIWWELFCHKEVTILFIVYFVIINILDFIFNDIRCEINLKE